MGRGCMSWGVSELVEGAQSTGQALAEVPNGSWQAPVPW